MFSFVPRPTVLLYRVYRTAQIDVHSELAMLGCANDAGSNVVHLMV